MRLFKLNQTSWGISVVGSGAAVTATKSTGSEPGCRAVVASATGSEPAGSEKDTGTFLNPKPVEIMASKAGF